MLIIRQKEVINMADVNLAKRQADAAARVAEQLGPGVMYALTTALPNMMNGAFWGFAMENEVRKHIASIQNARGNITARKLSNACILEVSPQYLVQSVVTCAPGLLSQSDVNEMMTKQAEAKISFERFLIARVRDGAKTGKLPFKGTIGIYCTNEVTSISNKGRSYPAFRLNISDFLQLCNQYGYMVCVNGQPLPPAQASQAGDALWQSMTVSPTRTGVFIDIMSTYSWEQMQQLDKAMKQRLGKK